jgi:hypothetical protein
MGQWAVKFTVHNRQCVRKPIEHCPLNEVGHALALRTFCLDVISPTPATLKWVCAGDRRRLRATVTLWQPQFDASVPRVVGALGDHRVVFILAPYRLTCK